MAGWFADKEIVLGVTGSIAAYKACDLASRLVQSGARVTAALTQSACELVRPATFEAITRRRVVTGLFEPAANLDIEHIALARRADLFLVAPATANIMAKAAHGIADDWLSTTLLATRAPILFAPAMNCAMYAHPATQANMALLQERGCLFVGPGEGRLACGEEGPGRLADNDLIVEAAAIALNADKDLRGCRVLLLTGGNHEPIDPVRYIGNRSSGRMGRALAMEALRRGARVTAIAGPAETPLPSDCQVIPAATGMEMFEAAQAHLETADVIIAAAAVADYRAETPADVKHKRGDDALTLCLTSNPDIAAWVGANKRPDQALVCFAAETGDLLAQAEAKMARKNADWLLVNQVGGAHCAFGADEVYGALLERGEDPPGLACCSKTALAEALFDRISERFNTTF